MDRYSMWKSAKEQTPTIGSCDLCGESRSLLRKYPLSKECLCTRCFHRRELEKDGIKSEQARSKASDSFQRRLYGDRVK